MFSMKVGIPKETFLGEQRVSVSPEGVQKLVKLGYEVKVENNAGKLSDFTNEMYEKKGAKIVPHSGVFDSDIVLKVRGPEREEVGLFNKKSTLISIL